MTSIPPTQIDLDAAELPEDALAPDDGADAIGDVDTARGDFQSPAPEPPPAPRVNDAMRVLSRMQTDLDVLTEGKRAATYAEVDEAFGDAIKALGVHLPPNQANSDQFGAAKPVMEGVNPTASEPQKQTATGSYPAGSPDGIDGGGIALPASNSSGLLDSLGAANASEAQGLGADERYEVAGNDRSKWAPDPAAWLQKVAPQAKATGRRTTELQKRDGDAKHGLSWHLGNVFSGRNWDGSRNEAAEARAQAERAASEGFARIIRKVDRAANDTKISPRFYYVQNPPMSFFDFPMEPPRIGVAQVNVKGAALATLDLATVLPWGKALGFLRADLTAAEEGAVTLVPRSGPKGVDQARHNANVLVNDSSGKIVTHQRFASGNMTAEERVLGFPKNMLATHTEARAVRGIDLRPGDTVTITGQLPPCTPCRGAMNQAAAQSGATIKYQWRQGGKTLIWVATPKRK